MMDDLKTLILKVFSKHQAEIKNLATAMDKVVNVKSVEISTASRKCGNDLYLQQNHNDEMHKKIFAYYCESIITAPNGSEQLTAAIADRSAFLLHIKKYQDCLNDANRALNIIKPSNVLLKFKLLCRKVECLKKLGLLMHLDVIKEAESCIEKIGEESREDCEKLLNRVKKLSGSKKPTVVNENNSVPETKAILSNVTIDYSDTYGRHLVAAKDYEPGDVIFAEKLHATNVAANKSSFLCNYCLKYAWSGIPCEQCDWAIFCSDQCKMKAWKEFHDIECKLIPHLKVLEEILLPFYNISLRLLILGIREAGSVIELKKVLRNVHDCKNNVTKGFYTNGNFNSRTIQSIYSLCCDGLSDSEQETTALGVILILFEILKYTKLLVDFKFQDIDDMMKSEDVTFVGSLLLKLIAIKSINSFSLSDSKSNVCEKSKSPTDCMVQLCCARGSGLSTLSSLMNHSCFPNASVCCTEDLKIVVFALQPIKKNSQIFNSYSTTFYFFPQIERQDMLKKYEFSCNCEACKQHWLPLLAMTKDELVQHNCTTKNDVQQKIYHDCIDIFTALDSKSDYFEKNSIEKLSKSIIQARRLKQPSLLLSLLMEALKYIFFSIYGMRPPTFGQCKV